VRIAQNLRATRLGRLAGEISFPNSLMAGIYVSADLIDPTPKKKVLQRYQWVILNAECVSPSESEQQSQGLLNRIVFCVGFDRPFIHRAIRCARG
jgi:hypothetical protein